MVFPGKAEIKCSKALIFGRGHCEEHSYETIVNWHQQFRRCHFRNVLSIAKKFCVFFLSSNQYWTGRVYGLGVCCFYSGSTQRLKRKWFWRSREIDLVAILFTGDNKDWNGTLAGTFM